MGRTVIVGIGLAVLIMAGVGLASVADCMTNGSDTTTFVGVSVESMGGLGAVDSDEFVI